MIANSPWRQEPCRFVRQCVGDAFRGRLIREEIACIRICIGISPRQDVDSPFAAPFAGLWRFPPLFSTATAIGIHFRVIQFRQARSVWPRRGPAGPFPDQVHPEFFGGFFRAGHARLQNRDRPMALGMTAITRRWPPPAGRMDLTRPDIGERDEQRSGENRFRTGLRPGCSSRYWFPLCLTWGARPGRCCRVRAARAGRSR